MRKNKGFSLVEMIIVVAIMAILVGIIAPIFIRYVEKTNVSADIQFCDTVYKAIYTACNDSNVLDADDGSDVAIGYFTAGSGTHGPLSAVSLDASGTAFYDEVVDTLGFDPFNTAVTRGYMKSSPASSSGVLSFATIGDGDRYVIYIDHSDNSGKKHDISFNAYANKDQVICAPQF